MACARLLSWERESNSRICAVKSQNVGQASP